MITERMPKRDEDDLSMTFRTDSVPDPARSDVGAVSFGTWRVGTPERQRATVDAIATAWEARSWPSQGLRSYSVLAGTDGDTLLHYAQLAEENTDHTPGQHQSWKNEVDAAVPGIERVGVIGCRLYRSNVVDGPTQDPGCIVLVTRVFDSPDPERARQLVDSLFSGSAEAPTPPGLFSTHLYISTDGTRVFNYAQWISEQAHRTAIENVPQVVEGNAQWRQAHTWPGLTSTTFQRFHVELHLTAP